MLGGIAGAAFGEMQAPDNSQSFNRYSYVLNNPMKYNDPSGHFFKKLFKEIGRFLNKYALTIVQIALITMASLVTGAGPWLAMGMAAMFGYAQVGVRGALTSVATSLMFMGIGNAFFKCKSCILGNCLGNKNTGSRYCGWRFLSHGRRKIW
ncbi:hypothetical protein KDD30_05700 [Photobacterium sp. GJ3]|uniref:hypothetical protein n=1 Tax=Photobacterium sp. GJ3 TaxID=2829502 RepID=UPI001B8B9D47|nr:hypothetical protein [Photobacterium sp. GJ3]QUJ68606.1 hypothetical protein KDD30_05700 [Photobacterium sp. GJ3]